MDQAIRLVQNWFRIGSALNRYYIGSGLVRMSFRACRDDGILFLGREEGVLIFF